MYTDYLTEEKLKNCLEILFPNSNILSQVKVPGTRYKSDYQVDNLIIEFDGFRHFSIAKTVKRDIEVNRIWKENGLNVIHIPYFIQLDSTMIKHYFNIGYDSSVEYPHGFISELAMKPDDFNTSGYKLYLRILNCIPEQIRKKIELTTKECYFG